MRQTVTLTGMVLMATPIGDYDKRLVILTKERGRITAFAKGARRQNSSLLAVANPFVFGEFGVYEGRNAYTLVSANIENYFMEVRQDFEGTCYGLYFMEFANEYTRENNDEKEMLLLLYASLRALIKPNISKELIRYIFELKALVVNGESPCVFQCSICGTQEEEVLHWFSSQKLGVICDHCYLQATDRIQLLPSTLYTLQYIVSSSMSKLYTFTVTKDVLYQIKKIVGQYLKLYVNKRFKSLEILQELS